MARRSGINMSDVKVSNRAMILNQVRDNPKSRKDIAEKLKLTPAAITMLVNELIEEGCVQESGLVDEPGRVGRKKVFVELNKDYRYIVGINIEGKVMTVGIGNLKYEVLASTELPIGQLSPEAVLARVPEAVRRLVIDSRVREDKILGVGVGIVGKVDKKEGISLHAYGIWDRQVPIAEILNESLGLPVIVQNNVRTLALAEMSLTLHKQIRNMVFLKLGPGIGSAVILDKDIYKGANNSSGEIGHMIADAGGKKCQCGMTGCLETVASVQSVIEDIQREDGPDRFANLKRMAGDLVNLRETHLVRAYLDGDREVVPRIDRLISYLSVGIINSIKIYDPHKLVLYSEMFSEPRLYEKLIEELDRRNVQEDLDVRIDVSHLEVPKCVGGIVAGARELFFRKGGILE